MDSFDLSAIAHQAMIDAGFVPEVPDTVLVGWTASAGSVSATQGNATVFTAPSNAASYLPGWPLSW